jgi:hypothetical protein
MESLPYLTLNMSSVRAANKTNAVFLLERGGVTAWRWMRATGRTARSSS